MMLCTYTAYYVNISDSQQLFEPDYRYKIVLLEFGEGNLPCMDPDVLACKSSYVLVQPLSLD